MENDSELARLQAEIRSLKSQNLNLKGAVVVTVLAFFSAWLLGKPGK